MSLSPGFFIGRVTFILCFSGIGNWMDGLDLPTLLRQNRFSTFIHFFPWPGVGPGYDHNDDVKMYMSKAMLFMNWEIGVLIFFLVWLFGWSVCLGLLYLDS